MTVVGEAVVLVRPLTAGFAEKVIADTDKAMVGAGRKAGASFGSALSSAIPGANGLQKGIVGVAAAALGAAVAGVHMANTFNNQLLLLHTQAGASTAEMNNMKKATLALAPSVGTGPDKLAEALYHIESTGYRGAAALDQLKIAAEGAKIGQANLDDTTYALTSTLMTGISGINGAKSAMAALDAIVGTGDMHMQDLNGAISTGFLATAETFGVSLQSVGAALAYMTDRGSGAQESATRLRMSLALLAAPSNQSSKMLTAIGLGGAEVTARTGAMTSALQAAHLTTTQLADDLRKPDGLQVALTHLVTKLHDSGLSADAAAALISRAFGGGRSGAAIMSLVQHLDVLKGKYEQQIQIAGQFDERWKATTDATSFRWAQFTTLVQTDLIKMGEALMPFVNSLGSGLFHILEAAPHTLVPIGEGLRDVGREIGNVVTELEPVGRVLLLAFGGASLVAIHTVGFLLRDTVAPALHIVAEGLHLLVGTTPGVVILSTVLAYKLVPAIIAMVREFAVWAYEKILVGMYDMVVAAESLSAGLSALSGPVLAVSVAIGLAVGVYEHYTHAKQQATQATNDLVTALQHEAGGAQNSILAELGKQLNDLGVGDNIQRLGLNITDVEQAIESGGPAWDNLQKQLYLLTHNSSLSGAQLKANNDDVYALMTAIFKLGGSLNAADSQYARQRMNQQLLNTAVTAGKPPLDALALANADAAAAGKLLAAANKDINASVFTSTQALAKQVNLLQDYSNQAKVTGQDIQNTINANITMLAKEGDNINRLSAQHVDPGFIQALKDQGPQYVAAAAGLGNQALAALNASWLKGQTQLQHTGAAIGRALAPAAVDAATAALSSKQDAMHRAAQITFYNTVQGALANVVSIASTQGGNIGGRFGDGLTRSKDQVLAAALNAMPAPVRAATLAALGIATDAGGRLPHNLAAAILANSPAASAAADAMRRAVQARVDMLHGKTVEVRADDLASGALATINGDIQQLEGLNNTLKAMRYADGGFVPGSGAARADDRIIRVSSQEHVTAVPSAHANRDVLTWMDRNPGHRLPGFADGGEVWPVLMGRYAQSVADGIDPARLTGTGIPGSVMSWLPTVLMALQLNHAPLRYAPAVLGQINFESGGRPNATQQVIDINTFNGSGGALGIMQVLLATFLANHVPGTSMNPFDPLANIAAGIHHAINDDPGGLDYLGKGHGYDAGGLVPPGRHIIINRTGGNEWLDNDPQHQARVQNGRQVPKLEQTNHFYGVDLDEALTEAGARLMHTLTTTMR